VVYPHLTGEETEVHRDLVNFPRTYNQQVTKPEYEFRAGCPPKPLFIYLFIFETVSFYGSGWP
jgi:hypothetical protein